MFDAMASSSRPHPYRATSTVNTPADLELLLGLLDTDAFLVTGTLLHPDRF